MVPQNDEKRNHNFRKSGVPLQRLGINQVQLLSLLNERLQSIHKKNVLYLYFYPYRSIVREAVHKVMSKQNLSWKDLNAIPGEYIINKHTMRDRTEVITERNEQLKESRDNKLLISAFTNVYFVLALYIFQKLAVCSFPQIVNSRNLLFNS